MCAKSHAVSPRSVDSCPCGGVRSRKGGGRWSNFSYVQLSATLWTAAHQAPPSPAFSRPGHWGAVVMPPPGGLPDSGIKPAPLKYPELAGRFFTCHLVLSLQSYECQGKNVGCLLDSNMEQWMTFLFCNQVK